MTDATEKDIFQTMATAFAELAELREHRNLVTHAIAGIEARFTDINHIAQQAKDIADQIAGDAGEALRRTIDNDNRLEVHAKRVDALDNRLDDLTRRFQTTAAAHQTRIDEHTHRLDVLEDRLAT